ncbi:hypothetical protein IWZ03DRAFT_212450 [Phyllosticta citriasiana]|uniref:Secreted protein n=1 Tax=Phyllosticta citriasiana TaxID=595635 RepID=A0ABR1KJC6_9PEZI
MMVSLRLFSSWHILFLFSRFLFRSFVQLACVQAGGFGDWHIIDSYRYGHGLGLGLGLGALETCVCVSWAM